MNGPDNATTATARSDTSGAWASWRRVAAPMWTRVLLVYFTCRVLAGVIVTVPLAMAVASVTGPHPRADAMLWDPGGLMLLETLRLLAPQRGALGWLSALLAIGVIFALLLPLGALIAHLTDERSGSEGARGGLRKSLLRGAERFGPLALLLGLTAVVQAVVLVFVTIFLSALAGVLGLGPRGQDLMQLAGLLLGLFGLWQLGLVQDMVRVVLLRRSSRLGGALVSGLSAFRRNWKATLLAAGWRGVSSGMVLLAAGWLSWNWSHRQTPVLAAVVLQLVAVFIAVQLRASWLRWVVQRLSQPAERSDKSRSVA